MLFFLKSPLVKTGQQNEHDDFFQSWKLLPVCLTSSFIIIAPLWVSVCFSLQLCQWLVTVTRCSVWSVFLSAMNPCNHGRGPRCTMNVCCKRCAHTHTHTLAHTHKLSPHPMGNRADHVLNPSLSLLQFSRTYKRWHTLVHMYRHAHRLAHAHTAHHPFFTHTLDLVSWPRKGGSIGGQSLMLLGKRSLIACTVSHAGAEIIVQIQTQTCSHTHTHT